MLVRPTAPGMLVDAVVDHAVDHVGRMAVGRGPAGLDASALVDGDVDDHRAVLHPAEVIATHQAGRRAPVINTAPITRSARSIDSRIVCRSE